MRAATSTLALALLAALASCQPDAETCGEQERRRRECVGGARIDALVATAKCALGKGCEEPRLALQPHDGAAAERRRCVAAELGVDVTQSLGDCMRGKGFDTGGGCPDAALVLDTQCAGAAACIEDGQRAADELCAHATVSPECTAMRDRARCECVQQMQLDKQSVLAAEAACDTSAAPTSDKPAAKEHGGPVRVKRTSHYRRKSYPKQKSYSPRRSSYSKKQRSSYRPSSYRRGGHYRGRRAAAGLHHGHPHYPHYPHNQGAHHRAGRSVSYHGHGHGYPKYPHYPRHHGGGRGKRDVDGSACAQLIDADCSNLPAIEFGGRADAVDEWCAAG